MMELTCCGLGVLMVSTDPLTPSDLTFCKTLMDSTKHKAIKTAFLQKLHFKNVFASEALVLQ